jgi:hypothetical protein
MKLKFLCCKLYHQESGKTIHRMRENIYKTIYLIRYWYPEYIKNSYNAKIKIQITQLKMNRGWEWIFVQRR